MSVFKSPSQAAAQRTKPQLNEVKSRETGWSPDSIGINSATSVSSRETGPSIGGVGERSEHKWGSFLRLFYEELYQVFIISLFKVPVETTGQLQ